MGHAGLGWEEALRTAEALRTEVAAARSAADDRTAELSRLAGEMEPLAARVAAARQRWGDSVPVGPSQAETEDPVLIEWRETSAPWADQEYVTARAEAFIAALELHKALIIARADVFEANLAALMDLIAADGEPRFPVLSLAGRRKWTATRIYSPGRKLARYYQRKSFPRQARTARRSSLDCRLPVRPGPMTGKLSGNPGRTRETG